MALIRPRPALRARALGVIVGALLLIVAHAQRGAAQLCGDADGGGDVTVSDGVNVLRAAANLPSSCTVLPRCDANADGHVTVSDGVNVLRAAAGIPAQLSCACSPGTIAPVSIPT